MNGRRDSTRISTFKWPNQGRSCEQDWRLWRYHISRLYSRPRSKLLNRPLRQWIVRTHQNWTWWYAEITKNVYNQYDSIYVLFTMNNATRVSTRSGARWCTRLGVIVGSPANTLYRYTVQMRNRSNVLLQSISQQNIDELPPFVSTIANDHENLDPYFRFRFFSDNDDGSIISEKLCQHPSRIVGDGSYEKSDDSGSASFIWECDDTSSRVTNVTIVPSNKSTPYRTWNDPYRCELFADSIGINVNI